MKFQIPKVLLFGVLLILLSLIYKIIIFNIILLVLNVCLGPPITLNWEQGCLNLSDSPANREQIIFLPPTFLYQCWCIIDTQFPPGTEIPMALSWSVPVPGGLYGQEFLQSGVCSVFRCRLQCRLWCAAVLLELLGLWLYLGVLYSHLLPWQSCHCLNVCCIPCTFSLISALGDEPQDSCQQLQAVLWLQHCCQPWPMCCFSSWSQSSAGEGVCCLFLNLLSLVAVWLL